MNDAFTEFEHEGWGRVANKYDSTWSSSTRQFIPPLLDAAQLAAKMSILDVGCGPGYVSAAAAERGAIPTGVGSVLNTAQPRPGQSMAIFGTGGVGLCAVAGAAMAGCTPIIAIDLRAEKLTLAQQVGATHSIPAGESDPVDEIERICPGGVDFAIEATGRPSVMKQALASVRSQGGVAVVIGNARFGETVELDPRQFNMGKRLLGTWGGDNWPDRDYPRYCKLLAAGKMRIDGMLARTYALTDINAALLDLERGEVARPLIDMAAE